MGFGMRSGTLIGRLRDESGFALMEIVVSAAVLGIVALALLAGIDAAASNSGREKVRAVVASLAEQDQERMRAMRVVELPRSGPQVRDLPPIGGVTYTVTSQAGIVNDATGATESCLNETSLASYLKITSSAQVKGDTSTPPVTLSSLLAPPIDGGWLVVQLNGADNRALVGMPVNITGPANRTEATNATGCAVFGPIPAGDYQITLDTPEWTNPEMEIPVVETATVNTGKVTVRKLLYDLRGTVNVDFDTQPTYREWNEAVNGAESDANEADTASAAEVYANRPVQADEAHTMAAAHPGIPTTQMRVYAPAVFTPPTVLTKSAAQYTTKLFPFTSPYGFHGGGCADQHPTQFDTTYFDNFPGRVQVNADTTQAVSVREPALNLTVLDRSGLRAPNTASKHINVVLTHSSADNSCEQRIVIAGNLNLGAASPIHARGEHIPVPTGADADKMRIELGGTLKLPGLPFGKWNVCVDDASPTVTGQSRSIDVDLTSRAGSAPFKLDLNRPDKRTSTPCVKTPL